MNEWKGWSGGECPVSSGVLVDIKYRNDVIRRNVPASKEDDSSSGAGPAFWINHGSGHDIVAYRVSQPLSCEEAYDETTRGIVDSDEMRSFSTGATRGADRGKLDYEGFLSPLVLERFAVYMDAHRTQADGNKRESDNWQKGMPQESYIKSCWRHFMDWWKEHRGIKTKEGLENALCAVIFNAQGYLHEILKNKEGK